MNAMKSAGLQLITGIDTEQLANKLDALHAYNMLVMHWALGVRNRLHGQAALLLDEPLEEIAAESLSDAKRLSDRVAELDGAITADPGRLIEISPIDQFGLPTDTSDIGSILAYALERTRIAIDEYGALLVHVRDRDVITHDLLLGLLKRQVARESELSAATM